MNESIRIHREATVVICHEDVPIDIAKIEHAPKHGLSHFDIVDFFKGGVGHIFGDQA